MLKRFENAAAPVSLSFMRGQVMLLQPLMAKRKPRTLFEFGCGDCLLLGELQTIGYEVTGYEPAIQASRIGPDVAQIFPCFDAELPGIPDRHYDVAMALGSIDRAPDVDSARKILSELFRIARHFVILGYEDKPRLLSDAEISADIDRFCRGILHRFKRGNAHILLVEKPICSSST